MKSFCHISKILLINIVLTMIIFSTQKDIYRSLDGSFYEPSKYLNENLFNKTRYYQSDQSIQQNLTFAEKNYTYLIESDNPYQDIEYEILEQIGSEDYQKIDKINIFETISETNIFYDKFIFKKNIQNTKNSLNFLSLDFNSDIPNLKVGDDKNSKIDCYVNYTGLNYSVKTDEILDNNFYKNVINFYSINIVTYKNKNGVYIKKYIEGVLKNETEITQYINNKDDLDISKLKISKILPSFLYKKYYLFLIDDTNSNIYMLRINSDDSILIDYSNNVNNFSLDYLFTFKKDQIDIFEISHIIGANFIQDSSVYFVTKNNQNSGLYIISYSDKITNIDIVNSFNDPLTNELIDFDIVDASFDKDGCNIALKNYGMINYNTKTKTVIVLIKHPKIHKIDYYQYEKKNIGLFLNNSKSLDPENNSNEFLLELNKPNFIHTKYSVNKIFFVDNEKNEENLYENNILDISSDRSFIIEKNLGKVYLIGRNVPNMIRNIDTYFYLPENLKNSKYEYFNIVSLYETIKFNYKTHLVQGMLVFQNMENEFSFYNFNINKDGNFKCILKAEGKYSIRHEFYTYEKSQLTYFSLKNFIRLTKPEDEQDYEQDYTIFVIFIIAVSVGLLFVIYYLIKKFKARRIESNYRNING